VQLSKQITLTIMQRNSKIPPKKTENEDTLIRNSKPNQRPIVADLVVKEFETAKLQKEIFEKEASRLQTFLTPLNDSTTLSASLFAESLESSKNTINGLSAATLSDLQLPVGLMDQYRSSYNSLQEAVGRVSANLPSIPREVFSIQEKINQFLPKFEPTANEILSVTRPSPDRDVFSSVVLPSGNSENRELMKAMKEMQDKAATAATKDDLIQIFKEFESITERTKPENQTIEPSLVLEHLPLLANELVKYNRPAALEHLSDFFKTRSFFWHCGFSHKIDEITTLNKLKQILGDQEQGHVKKCKSNGHKSFLLVSNGFLITMSLEDVSNGTIRGAVKKK